MHKKIKRETNQGVIVVLEGNKAASAASSGVAPLCKAIHDVVGPEDQVLVLTLLYWNNNKNTNDGAAPAMVASPLPSMFGAAASSSRDQERFFGGYENYEVMINDNMDIKFLYGQEIGQRKKTYAEVFKPFFLTCHAYGVKFEVKIAAGYRPKDIVIEEANNAKAKWIVMDRCFAKDPSFRLHGTKCNIISVNDDGEAIFHNRSSPESSASTINRVKCDHKYLKLRKVPKSLSVCIKLPPISPPSSPGSITSTQNEKLKMVELELPIEGSTHFSLRSSNSISSRRFCDPNFVLRLPLKLSREEIEEIILEKISSDESQQFVVFEGFFLVYQCRVLVKMFRGDSGGVFLEAEKKAAFSMRHKNIMRLIGYNQSEDTTFLVFPFAERGTLDLCLSGLRGKEFKLTFQEKLKIAIGIAQGLRYLHEECPRGPIVHGKLLLSNVFVGGDLRPQVSGFGVATWLHFKQAGPILREKFAERFSSFEDFPDPDLVAQVKADVQSFGILLLRLFCAISVPQDDETLIMWARPLLLERAFHILLDKDEDWEDLDMHEMFRVMCTAFQCAMPKPDKRPCMSQVVSYLKGESFCVMQWSP